MVTEKGIVAALSKHKAQVRVQKSSACASCEARHACHIHGNKEMIVEVANTSSILGKYFTEPIDLVFRIEIMH